MKNRMYILFVLLFGSFCLSASDDIVNINDVADFFAGKYQAVTIECSEGTRLPIDINIDGDIVSVDSEGDVPLFINVNKTFYVRFPSGQDEDPLFSWDCKNWKSFLDFVSGNIEVSFDKSDDKDLVLHFNLTNEPRE